MGDDKSLIDTLSRLRGGTVLIVTIGNSLKGDDGIGPAVYERLCRTQINAKLINAGTVPENYIQTIVKAAPEDLLIIDAIDFGGEPGQIKMFRREEPVSAALSTHALSPNLFIEAIRSQLDVDVHIIGIQPGRVELGEPLSEAAGDAAARLHRILEQVFGVQGTQ